MKMGIVAGHPAQSAGDVDTGYGNALNVMRTLSEFESAGLAGIFLKTRPFRRSAVTSRESM